MHRHRLHHSIANEFAQIQSCSRSIKTAKPVSRARYSPVATPRAGSLIHSLHDPAYNPPSG
jgi:hypothetical protein